MKKLQFIMNHNIYFNAIGKIIDATQKRLYRSEIDEENKGRAFALEIRARDLEILIRDGAIRRLKINVGAYKYIVSQAKATEV